LIFGDGCELARFECESDEVRDKVIEKLTVGEHNNAVESALGFSEILCWMWQRVFI